MPLVQVLDGPSDALADHVNGRGGVRALRLTRSGFPGAACFNDGRRAIDGHSNSRGIPGSALAGDGNTRRGRLYLRSPPLRVQGQTLDAKTGRRLDGGSAGAGGTGP
jgi:hypothetical protein